MNFDSSDEWRNKNQHSTADEIDERQALELAVILDKWQTGEMPPWEVMYQTALSVGAVGGGFLFSYEYYRNCDTAEGARAFVTKSVNQRGAPLRQSDKQEMTDEIWRARQQHQASIEELKDKLRAEVLDEAARPAIHDAIDGIRKRLESAEFDSWATATAMAEVLLADSRQNSIGAHDFERKRYNCFGDFKEKLGFSKKEAGEKTKDISATLDAFTAESEADVKKPLARLFAEKRHYEESRREWVAEKENKYETEHGVSIAQLRAEAAAEKEAAFAAYMAQYDERLAAKIAAGKIVSKDDKEIYTALFRHYNQNEHLKTIDDEFGYSSFDFYYDGWDEPDEPPELIVPLDFPARKLCDAIEIAPSGTGLIQIFDKDEAHSWYPTSIGRITTYSLSFIPKNAEDMDALKNIVEKALGLLGKVPYKYEMAGNTSAGKSYSRVAEGLGSWHNETTHVRVMDGKASPLARVDLDDLMVLYYLLEPILEPSSQIAAAMNSARFAEERGAVLDPADTDGFGGGGHSVGNESGYLKKSRPEAVLKDALRDSLVDFALNEIDEAEFIVHLSTLAHHTLTGSVVDARGQFQTYAAMLADVRENKGAVATYDAALQERTGDLMRYLLNEPKDSKRPLYAALIATVREIAKPLKEQSRAKSRRETIEYRDMVEKRIFGHGGLFSTLGSTAVGTDEESQAVSSILAELEELKDEERFVKKDENAVTLQSQLVIAASAVETAIDGVHEAHVTGGWFRFKKGKDAVRHNRWSHEGTYITRTRGSPYARYELPEALKPFVAEGNRPMSVRAFLEYSRSQCG